MGIDLIMDELENLKEIAERILVCQYPPGQKGAEMAAKDRYELASRFCTDLDSLNDRISKLSAENYQLKLKLAAYIQNENRRYRYEQDYLPYDDDDGRE